MQLFEQNVKGNIPKSTFEMMMTKYNKEKKFIEEQLKQLTKLEQQQLIVENYEAKINKLIVLLESINESNVLEYDIIHSIINYITISSRNLENYQRKHVYNVTIVFSVLDAMIKEFMKNI